ncbi:hypothetical protein L1887_55504 [Cichorium endivia]|nr:hypothetical protein L1887_55504 [Cichorium endivia]
MGGRSFAPWQAMLTSISPAQAVERRNELDWARRARKCGSLRVDASWLQREQAREVQRLRTLSRERLLAGSTGSIKRKRAGSRAQSRACADVQRRLEQQETGAVRCSRLNLFVPLGLACESAASMTPYEAIGFRPRCSPDLVVSRKRRGLGRRRGHGNCCTMARAMCNIYPPARILARTRAKHQAVRLATSAALQEATRSAGADGPDEVKRGRPCVHACIPACFGPCNKNAARNWTAGMSQKRVPGEARVCTEDAGSRWAVAGSPRARAMTGWA